MTQAWVWGDIKTNGFGNEQQNGFVEVSPDAGSPFRRQRYSDIADILQGTITLSKIEYLQFMSWYNFDIKQGAIAFSFYDCRIDEYRTARIINKPTYSTNSTFYNVNVNLYLEPITILEDFVLIANENQALIADTDKRLVVTRKLRL